MKLFPSGVMALGGAGLQALGVALAVGPARSVGTAVALVVAGAALGGGGLLIGVRRHARVLDRKVLPLAEMMLIGSFSLFVPALGLLGLGATLALRARSVTRKVNTEVVETDAPPLPPSPLHTDETARFGPGSLEGILRHSRDPNTRLRVVLACRQLPGRLAVPLLRLALRDPVDDVRLLAYAVLESKERQIQSEIQSLYARASARQTGTFATLMAGAGAGAAPAQARPQIDVGKLQLPLPAHAKLAELYWELVYQGLVEGEMMSFSLERVLSHTAEVLRAGQGSPRMALLAGRALLLRGRSQEARAMLEDALRRGLPLSVVGPYLAEVDYLERKPAEVRRQIEAFRTSARLRPGLAVIVERWA
jgi:polysaccharide biosynthesis protein PelE